MLKCMTLSVEITAHPDMGKVAGFSRLKGMMVGRLLHKVRCRMQTGWHRRGKKGINQ